MGIHHVLDRYAFVNKHFTSSDKSTNAVLAGTIIHAEITDYIKNPTKRTTYHYQTLYFFQTLQALGWRAIDADVPLFDHSRNYRTRADVLALDPETGTTIVIEVKTTGATRAEAAQQAEALKAEELASDVWRAQLRTDTPISRALAQVTLEYHALRGTYAKLNAFVFFLFRNPDEFSYMNENEYTKHVGVYHPIESLLSDEFRQSLLQ